MGRILRHEHVSMRAAFAALLTTGMIAALLSLAALAAPSPAYAAELQGSGTADDPVLIYSTDDLVAWCNKLNGMGQSAERQQYARLMDDLTDPGPDGTEYGGAVTDDVISRMSHPDLQAAEFDGNGHLVELQLSGHGALFKTGGQPGGAGTTTIKDFHFIGSVAQSGNAGTLFEAIGQKDNASEDRKLEILDCTNQASVSGDQATGGLIGSFYDNDHGALVIERCSNFGEIVSANGHAGGLAGSIVQIGFDDRPGRVRYCTNNGAIKSMGGSFKTSYSDDSDPNKPTTIGGSSGGLVGYLSYTSTVLFTLHHDYNQGGISSSSAHGYCGGLVGFVDTTWTPINFVSACYNAGPIQPSSRTAEYAGGLFGYATLNAVRIEDSLTVDSTMPSDAVSDITRNGTIVPEYVLWSDGYIHLDPQAYIGNDTDMFIYNDYPTLEGVGVARSVKVTLMSPATNTYSTDDTYWNTVFSHNGGAYPQEGYRLAYWTREAPDTGSTWSKPPKEFKSDPNDIHDRIYGGEPVLYAYTVPSSTTVKFDLNAPTGYTCSLDPEGATKTVVYGEPVGALPTATCTNPHDSNDTRTFLGWATREDGNDPHAEWISESTDNLHDFQNENTYTVTLYAQWADMSIPVEIVRQPKDYTISALAEGWSHKVFFDVGLSYPTNDGNGCKGQLQFRKDGSYYYEDVDADHNIGMLQFYFDLESSEQAAGDYRLKVEYYEPGNVLGTLYTSSARVVMDIPQSEAEVSTVILKEDVTSDEVLGTHSYDVSGNILGDLPSLIDESVPGNFAHMAWIEGGPDNVVPTEKQYVDNTRSFTLKKQHLKEGQTYTLCVSRVMDNYFQPWRYQGESEPYRVSFAVPYADSVAASITEVQVTEEPVVQDGKALDFTAGYEVPLGGTFNLASDVQYTQPQPSNREVSAQWQYSTGKDWVDVPDDLFARDKKNKPIRGIVWSDDRTSARVCHAERPGGA